VQIQRLALQNFLSYENASLDLADRGLVLVEGLNKDAGGSNGAGKSALFEAMCFGLFGRTNRFGASNAKVCRNGKGETVVYHEVLADSGKLLVYRHRDHSKYGNKLLLYVNGADKTKGSDAETQKVVNEYLQLDYETFCAAVMFPQSAAGFSSLNDGNQKYILESLLGMGRFAAAQERAKTKLKDIEKAYTAARTSLAELTRAAEDLRKNLQTLRTQELDYAKTKEAKVQELEAKCSAHEEAKPSYDPSLAAEYERLKGQASSPAVVQARQLAEHSQRRISDTEKEIERLRGSIDTLNTDLAGYPTETPPYPEQGIDGLKKDYQRISQQKASIEAEMTSKNVDLASADSTIRSLDSAILCTRCGQVLTAKAKMAMLGDSGVVRNQVIIDLQRLSAALKEINSNHLIAEGLYFNAESYQKWEEGQEKQKLVNSKGREIISLEIRANTLKSGLSSVREILERARSQEAEANVLKTKIDGQERAMREWLARRTELLTSLEEKQAESSPYAELVRVACEELETKQTASTRKSSLLFELEGQVNILNFWIDGFGNKGVKSLLLDTITPILNANANEYLSILTDGTAKVRFSTQTTLQSGEQRDRFNVAAEIAMGSQDYAGASGGEHQRIDIATLFALGDLASSRAHAPISLRLLDEPFSALDSVGAEQVVRLLKTKIVPKSGTVLVMTHDDNLKALFDNRILVVKEGGISRIEL